MSSIFSIFRRGLEKTKTSVQRFFSGEKKWDNATFEELEYALISADFGVAGARAIVAQLREDYETGKIATAADASAACADMIEKILSGNQRPVKTAEPGRPTVILFVGVNGSGKTTTVGKLAYQLARAGKKVMLGACDTFRAAAVEQLKMWGERTGTTVVAGNPNADPASVAFDAAKKAAAEGCDYLLIDTAGRQHNKRNLMDELGKIKRSITKACPGAPDEVWLTVDASMGSNAVNQAREFSSVAELTGLVLTKLDGSGKGGMAVALHREFHLPTFFTGMGEAPEDLLEFNPEYYAKALFGLDDAREL